MFELLRAFLCVFVAAQFLMLSSAKALSGERPYTILLTFEEAQEVLHCPWCTHPSLENATYFVRTAEDLNIAFADLGIALNAAVLLNIMADAQSQCDRTGYDLAFDEYAILIGLGKQEATQEWAKMDGVLALLDPHRDLSSLAEYVVPPFHPCGVRRYAGAKGPGMRWSWRIQEAASWAREKRDSRAYVDTVKAKAILCDKWVEKTAIGTPSDYTEIEAMSKAELIEFIRATLECGELGGAFVTQPDE